LTLHPARRPPNTEKTIIYLADGRARGTTQAVHREIDEVLGLNVAVLRLARRQVIRVVLDRIVQARGLGTQAGRLAALRRLHEPYVAQAGDLPPFPVAVLPLLERALARVENRGRRLRKAPRI
jgi:hypothetical protein